MPNYDEATRSALLDKEVAGYVRRGYRVVSRTPTTAQLLKPKTFAWLLAIILLLCFVVPFLIYLLIYMGQHDSQVYLTVDANGKIHRS